MSYTDRFRTDGPPLPPRTSRSSSSSSMTLNRLTSMIERACNPSLAEPNLSLNLDIADIIKQKQGQFPRHAGVEIAKLINSRTPQTAILALGLLDICVKNCGYPFQLQISRKEFLNEMVRKFPERPPMQYSRVMMLILEQISYWRETICKTKKGREDFGYIRDMYRLLEYKGYIFPELNMEDAAVLMPSDNTVRSASEIEQEEREAQSAKLQELIRRGTPRDLQEANHLMGIMAGFKKDDETDYHAKAAKDLDKLKRKADLLEEMLKNAEKGKDLKHDDVYSDIVSQLKNAQPKINRMINDDSEKEDEQAMMRLLALNDYITSLITKYDLIKQGHHDEAWKVQVTAPPGTTSTATGQDTTSRQAIVESLIDIDDDEPAPAAQPSSQHTTENLIDALDGLSFGNIALGGGQQTPTNPPKVDLTSSGTPTPTPPPPPPRAPAPAPADEWEFFSAPVASSPGEKTLTVLDSSLYVEFKVSQQSDKIKIQAIFSNKSPLQLLTNLHFQIAVPKSYKLEMQALSSDKLQPNQSDKATQIMTVTPANPGLKLRWKVSYNIGVNPITEDGQLENVF